MKKSSALITVLILIIVVLAVGWIYTGSRGKSSKTSPAATDTAHVNPIPPDSLHH